MSATAIEIINPSPTPLPVTVPEPDSVFPFDAPVPGLPPTHHPSYYFEDEVSVFLVENHLFKVHRHFLVRESPVFQWMFACPPGPDGEDGRGDEKPIPLPGVLSCEFSSLLDYFYTREYSSDHLSFLGPVLQDWINLLSISTRFDFERVRQHAIQKISALDFDPVQKIVLAQKYDIPQWNRAAYAALCQRVDPLEELEAEKLGLRVAILIARAREAVRADPLNMADSPRISTPPAPVAPPAPVPVPAPPLLYNFQAVARIVDEVFNFAAPAGRGRGGSKRGRRVA